MLLIGSNVRFFFFAYLTNAFANGCLLLLSKLADICNRTPAHTLISYNSSQLVKNRFESGNSNWEAQEYDLTYTMRSTSDYQKDQKERKELLLFNYERGLISMLETPKAKDYYREETRPQSIKISPKRLKDIETDETIVSDIE